MNKQIKILVPELRFPEFRNAEEWNADVLGGKGIACFVKERMPLAELELDSYISTENLLSDYGGVTTASKLPPAGSFTRFRKGDILISNIRPYLKKVWSADTDGAASNDVIVIRADSNLSELFLSFLLKNDDFIDYVMVGAKGVKMPRGDKSLMEEYPVAFPDSDEQKKIADCLSSLDDLISAQSEKLNKLKSHKKGLMQQLFPAEGETLPRIRFKEFRARGEWEEKMLGQIGDVSMCKRIFAEETNGNDGIPFFKIGTLGSKPDAFISKELFDEYKARYNFPRKGEVLITCSGTVGKCLTYNGEDAYYQDSNIVWIDNPNLEVRNDLLYYLLSNVNWGQLNSTTITRIYGADLRSLEMKFPKSNEEQREIADCFSSIDDLIAAQTQKIDVLKEHKKGLMQQLFPAMP